MWYERMFQLDITEEAEEFKKEVDDGCVNIMADEKQQNEYYNYKLYIRFYNSSVVCLNSRCGQLFDPTSSSSLDQSKAVLQVR